MKTRPTRTRSTASSGTRRVARRHIPRNSWGGARRRGSSPSVIEVAENSREPPGGRMAQEPKRDWLRRTVWSLVGVAVLFTLCVLARYGYEYLGEGRMKLATGLPHLR